MQILWLDNTSLMSALWFEALEITQPNQLLHLRGFGFFFPLFHLLVLVIVGPATIVAPIIINHKVCSVAPPAYYLAPNFACVAPGCLFLLLVGILLILFLFLLLIPLGPFHDPFVFVMLLF